MRPIMYDEDLEFYINKSKEWITTLESMKLNNEFKYVYSWVEKEIGETYLLLDMLKRIKQNKKMERNNEDNSL